MLESARLAMIRRASFSTSPRTRLKPSRAAKSLPFDGSSGRVIVAAPGCGEAAGRHGFHPAAGSGFHLTGVTASGVPLLEPIQPDAMGLRGLGSL
jgi:hypothetical protein